MIACLNRAAAALFVGLLCLSSTVAAQDRAGVAEIIAQRGPVQAQRGSAIVALSVGDRVFRSDEIFCGTESRVKLRFLDGTIIVLGANSRLAVAEYSMNVGEDRRSSGIFAMMRGILRAIVAPGASASRFEVQTETAVASVRSTEWMVEAGAGHTAVFVVEGAVAVASSMPRIGGAVLLNAGEGTDVPAGQAPTAPVRWGPARAQVFLDRTTLP